MGIILTLATLIILAFAVKKIADNRDTVGNDAEAFNDDRSDSVPMDPEDFAYVMTVMENKRVLYDSVDVISTTIHPKTFFYRYNLAISKIDEILSVCHSENIIEELTQLYEDLTENKSDYIIDMIDRAKERGRLHSIASEVYECIEEMTDESFEYFNDLIEE